MGSRIEELREKYWKGETSLDEEQELKKHFAENPGLDQEALYFRALNTKKNSRPSRSFKHPGKTATRAKWSVAAAVVIGLMAAILVIQDAKNQRDYVVEDPQEAYEITRKALLMVSSGLNEGKQYSEELTKINKAEEIIQE